MHDYYSSAPFALQSAAWCRMPDTVPSKALLFGSFHMCIYSYPS